MSKYGYGSYFDAPSDEPDDDAELAALVEELDDEEQAEQDEFAQIADHQILAMQQKMKRPLTQTELQMVSAEVWRQFDEDRPADAEAAYKEALARSGRESFDLNTDAGRANYYDERVKEMQPEPEFRESYDLNDPEQKAEYMGLRFQGYDVSHLNKENQQKTNDNQETGDN